MAHLSSPIAHGPSPMGEGLALCWQPTAWQSRPEGRGPGRPIIFRVIALRSQGPERPREDEPRFALHADNNRVRLVLISVGPFRPRCVTFVAKAESEFEESSSSSSPPLLLLLLSSSSSFAGGLPHPVCLAFDLRGRKAVLLLLLLLLLSSHSVTLRHVRALSQAEQAGRRGVFFGTCLLARKVREGCPGRSRAGTPP